MPTARDKQQQEEIAALKRQANEAMRRSERDHIKDADEMAALRQRVEELARLDRANIVMMQGHVEENGHLKAKLARLRKALERMVKDGCGFAPRVCPERSPDPGDWCWSCQARAALRGGGE